MPDPITSAGLDGAPSGAPSGTQVVWDAGAYLALARSAEGDITRAREQAAKAAAAERARGLEPAASPTVLWALLAECGVAEETESAPPARRGTRAGASVPTTGASPDRATLARVAVAACIAHCAPAAGEAGARSIDVDLADELQQRHSVTPPTVIEDVEALLARAVGGRVAKEHGAWAAYLISLTAELGDEPTADRVRRLAGPLAHVRERAEQAAEDYADEVQEVVAAAYDAAAGAWEEETGVEERQAIVAAHGEAIDRAIVAGRVDLAWLRADGARAGDDRAGAAERVATRFATGVRLWREVVRLVVGGDVPLEGRRWRETLWALQVAFGTGASGVAAVVTADATLLRAARAAGIAAVRDVPRAGGRGL